MIEGWSNPTPFTVRIFPTFRGNPPRFAKMRTLSSPFLLAARGHAQVGRWGLTGAAFAHHHNGFAATG
jgi:hypothetical protein